MAELYADLILSVPNNSMLGVRPYQHFFISVNLRDFEASVPERDVPVVVHAPSDKGVKGTRNILAALERLRAQGVAFDLRLMHGVPHQQVLVELSQADVAIDQLNLPLHGMFGLEGMASGCVLATCNREDYEPFPPNRPIWHIDAVNLESQLRQLLTNKEARIRLAREGRKYVEQYHDHTEVARRVLDSLQGPVTEYDHYPTFFARSYKLENGEQIPEYLKRMTAAIVQRRGLPPDVDPHEMVQRGLMSADALTPANPVPTLDE
jgi:Glycosyl transferases group 1